ncbi:MAG: GNAT family N-acetyltransferase [Devosia sp.]
MADEFTVEREHTVYGGRYVVRLPDGSEAEMTYRQLDPGTIIADHTGVPPAHRTKGIALKLVETAIADARRDGFKIVPQCTYVAAQFRRHPEWSDLRA